MARVAVFGSLPESLLNFRGPLLTAMVARGHDVIALSPPATAEVVGALSRLGVEHHAVALSRTGLDPVADLGSLLALKRLLSTLRPDCLLAYTIKPVVYGALAARLAGVPRTFALITGLGYSFAGEGLKARLVGLLARRLYRLALREVERVFFQNADNMKVFVDLGLLRSPRQACLVPGSGVDTEHFSPVPLPGAANFLLIARLLRDKGIAEYAAAARLLRARHPSARVRLAGWFDDNPAAITRAELDGWVCEGSLEYLGPLTDVRPALAETDVYVLPSYHEGMPRTVLEALAMGRPVVTTDVPGCRDSILPGETGLLVPPRDPAALARAMERFVEEPGLAATMGAAGRRLAETRFDVRRVNQIMLDAMELAR